MQTEWPGSQFGNGGHLGNHSMDKTHWNLGGSLIKVIQI